MVKVLPATEMKTEVGRTQVALLLREYDCCARCVQRMLYGATSKPKDFVYLRDAIRESPLCPVCCGLLHHPRMCAFPPGYTRIKYRSSENETERNLLAELVSKLDVTDFEYLACQFKLTEPINHMFREHIMWTRLYNLLPNYMGQKSHYDPNWHSRYRRPSERITCLFNFRDLEEWKRSRITQKQVWYWIVSPSLSDVLGVPTICQESELRDPAFLRSNNIDPTLCDPGALSMVISTVLSDPQTHAECIDFLGRAKRSGNELVRRLASDLLNLSRTKQLKNERNEHRTTDQSTLFEFGRDRMTNLIKQLWQQTPSSWLALQTKPCLPRIARITLERLVQITLAGRYVKLSRRMPQTWRMIDSNQNLPSCVKEIILGPIREQFGTASRLRFFSASSEDADARCLGFGRPFIVRVENFESFLPDLIRSLSEGGHKPQDSNGSSEKPPIDLLRLASMINARGGGKVMVRDLQMISAENAKKVIKYVKKSKFKRCRALCWCPLGGLTTELIQQLHQQCSTLSRIPQPANGATLVWPPEPVSDNSSSYARIRFGPISVDQCTPICRLHRQPFSCRSTKIQSFELASFEAAMAIPDMDLEDYKSWLKIYPPNELFILHIHCAAGTYVKEFVHGDLGRSVPNLSSLIGRQLDLLALDVCAIDLDWPPRLPDPNPMQKTLS